MCPERWGHVATVPGVAREPREDLSLEGPRRAVWRAEREPGAPSSVRPPALQPAGRLGSQCPLGTPGDLAAARWTASTDAGWRRRLGAGRVQTDPRRQVGALARLAPSSLPTSIARLHLLPRPRPTPAPHHLRPRPSPVPSHLQAESSRSTFPWRPGVAQWPPEAFPACDGFPPTRWLDTDPAPALAPAPAAWPQMRVNTLRRQCQVLGPGSSEGVIARERCTLPPQWGVPSRSNAASSASSLGRPLPFLPLPVALRGTAYACRPGATTFLPRAGGQRLGARPEALTPAPHPRLPYRMGGSSIPPAVSCTAPPEELRSRTDFLSRQGRPWPLVHLFPQHGTGVTSSHPPHEACLPERDPRPGLCSQSILCCSGPCLGQGHPFRLVSGKGCRGGRP